MKEGKLLLKLKGIEARLNEIERQINYEGFVCAMELDDRLDKGLTGEAATAHYNAWMAKYNLKHLMLK